jgi:type III pantothenate kinase
LGIGRSTDGKEYSACQALSIPRSGKKMDKIYLDIGNSYIKAAKQGEIGWNVLRHVRTVSVDILAEFISGIDEVEKVVVSSVRQDVVDELEYRLDGKTFLNITSSLIPPYYLDYDTPRTLGIDRFLACLGAGGLTSKNVVVIDAGTACTVDLMTSDKIFRGGVIMPGLDLFHKSMRQNLVELPPVERRLPDKWPGKSTRESLQWGINGVFLMSILSCIDRYERELGGVDVYVTGGDAVFILEHLGKERQIKHRSDLIFEGMVNFENL